jgi:phosphatidate phosphatase LPIN
MQYVRSISGSVSKTWNSINPATLSGAIDVVVVEGNDGMLLDILKVYRAFLI